MAAVLLLLLVTSVASGLTIRYTRDISKPSSGAHSGSFSSSSSYSSSNTKVAPGPGGSGNFNAFSGTSNSGNPPFGSNNFGSPPFGSNSFGSPPFGSNSFGSPPFGSGGFNGASSYAGDGQSLYSGSGHQTGQSPFNSPGFNPFVPQYGQQYPYMPFPTFAAPFDFMSFLNQYFQSLQNFQQQAQFHAQQAGNSGFSPDSNEVGGVAMATYSPQGGYGSANIFPAPEGSLESRFGGSDETPQNSVGPVGSVSGSFKPPGGSSYGVFTSSSSGSSDINGKKTSFKQSTIGVNDNGKVTTYTAHDP